MARQNGQYEVTVVDAGAGIPHAARARVFERFFRVDTARSRTENTATSGAGLGLAIARRIAEMHDGQLEARRVASRPDGVSVDAASSGGRGPGAAGRGIAYCHPAVAKRLSGPSAYCHPAVAKRLSGPSAYCHPQSRSDCRDRPHTVIPQSRSDCRDRPHTVIPQSRSDCRDLLSSRYSWL
jgi:hypothetical protein